MSKTAQLSRMAKGAAFASVLLAASTGLMAAGKKTNVGPKAAAETPTSAAAGSLHTAHALVRYGDANKDPLALITAARMMKEAGAQPSDAKREGAASGEAKAGGDKYTVDGVLGRARTLAAGRADLVALADDVAKSGTRGATSGPRRWNEVVRGGYTDRYRITFRGGEPALVAVSGDGDSDLDLYIYDENGNLICKDEDRTDDMICRWTPRWTGQFIIAIKNLGVANQYVAAHN